MQRVTRVMLAAQYAGDAASAEDVLGMCQQITQYSGNLWSILSDDGATLVLREYNDTIDAQWPVRAGQWVLVAPDVGILNRMTDAAYKARYHALDSIIASAVSGNVDAIAASRPVQSAIAVAVRSAMYGGFGVGVLPILTVANPVADIAVTITPEQPDTGYVGRAFAVSGAAVLTALEIVSITKESGTRAIVRVRNTGLGASVGGLLLLHVTAPVSGTEAAGGQKREGK